MRLCLLGTSIIAIIDFVDEHNLAGIVIATIFFIFSLIDNFWEDENGKN